MIESAAPNYWSIRPPKELIKDPVSVLELLTIHGKPQRSALQILEDQHPQYSSLSADGNEFYRSVALAFILSKADNISFDNVFSKVDQVDLAACEEESVPKQFLSIYDNAKLKNMFRQGWVAFVEEDRSCSPLSEIVIRTISQRYLFDTLLILYFRAVNLLGTVPNSSCFTKRDPESQPSESRIRRFGQGIVKEDIKLMSKALRTDIYLVTINGESNISTEVLTSSNNFYSPAGSVRLPLLNYRSTYHVLYTLKQSDQLRTFPKKQLGQNNQHYQESATVRNQNGRPFADEDKSLCTMDGHSNAQFKDSKVPNSHMAYTFREEDFEQQEFQEPLPSNRPQSSLQTLKPSRQQSVQFQQSQRKWSFTRVLRLVFLLLIVNFLLVLAYRWFREKSWQSNALLKPARQVTFTRTPEGQYVVY